MATNHTENYALNLWTPQDSFLREEFNENTEKIDAAVKAVDTKASGKADASALTALAQTVAGKADASALTAAVNTLNAAVAGKANTSAVNASLAQKADLTAMNAAVAQRARIATGTYTGDGTATQAINLGFRPKAVLIYFIDYDQSSHSSTSGTTVWGGLTVEGMADALVELTDSGFKARYRTKNDNGHNVYLASNVSGNKYCYIALC